MKTLDDTVKDRVEYLKKLKVKNAGFEYRQLWILLNFALVKDGLMKRIGAEAFGIFIVIRIFMNNKDNIAYPSLKTISRLSGSSLSTVRRKIGILERHGWLKKLDHKKKDKGKFSNTRYKILQTDFIRGSNQPGFMKKPLSNMNNGDEA